MRLLNTVYDGACMIKRLLSARSKASGEVIVGYICDTIMAFSLHSYIHIIDNYYEIVLIVRIVT